ncbi:MAG TPA: Ig-like domain-containing protein, partial [Pyrinomonadaceae bacterium]
MKQNRLISLVLIYALSLSFFIHVAPAQKTTAVLPKGLNFRLTELESTAVKTETPKPPEVFKLSDAEANAIIRRLPPIQSDASDEKEFSLRANTQPLPKTGKIIPVKFPSDERRDVLPVTASGALEIERFAPEGSAALVSDLTVTFSQPMIAVTSQTEASSTAPVKLTPEVKGRWRWLGTTTLVFDAEKRFPMATTFTAVIPKGTKAATGAELEKDFSWTFTTPPPKIEKFVPQKGQSEIYPPDTILAAKFNQEIDENAILPKIHVFAGEKEMPVRLITAEVDENYTAYQYLEKPKPKSWLAFRTVDLLPQNTDVRVVFEKGLPSAEGAGVSPAEQSFSFKTLEPLKLTGSYCTYKQNPTVCAPSDDFRLQFNRSLFPGKFDTSLVKIEPPIENAKIEASGTVIVIKGKKTPNTVYKVTLSGEAMDFYRQKIGQDITVEFKVGTEPALFFATASDLMTLDPNGKPEFSIYSRNQPGFKVRLYSVTPDDYLSFRPVLRDYYNTSRRSVPSVNFGRLIFEKTFETGASVDAFTETRIDLSEAFPGNFGHAILVAEPAIKNEQYDSQSLPVLVWIQSTAIGIDMLHDYEKLTAFATELKTGKPLAQAEVSLRYDKGSVLNSVTDAAGIAEFILPDYGGRPFLLVKQGADSAILSAPQ